MVNCLNIDADDMAISIVKKHENASASKAMLREHLQSSTQDRSTSARDFQL